MGAYAASQTTFADMRFVYLKGYTESDGCTKCSCSMSGIVCNSETCPNHIPSRYGKIVTYKTKYLDVNV